MVIGPEAVEEIPTPSTVDEPEIAVTPVLVEDNNIEVTTPIATTSTAETAEDQQLRTFRVPESNAFVIQLVGVSSYNLALSFARENNLVDSVWIYETRLGEQPWFVIVYENYYTTLDTARDAITLLPNYNQLSPPFVKSTNQIARELQR